MKRISASVNAAVRVDGTSAERHGGEAFSPAPHRRQSIAQLFDATRYYAALLLFGAASLLFSLGAIPLRLLLSRGAGVRVGRAAISACFRAYLRVVMWSGLIKVDLSALAELRNERGLLIVANHPSILDAVLLVSALPRAACIMKSSLAESRILGGGARLAGYLRNVSPQRLIGDAVNCLREGGQLLVFPEGTRTRTASLDKLAAGFAVMAREAEAPIQAVVIHTPRVPAWRCSVFHVPELPLVYRVSLGRRYSPCKDARRLAQQIEADLLSDLTTSAPDRRSFRDENGSNALLSR